MRPTLSPVLRMGMTARIILLVLALLVVGGMITGVALGGTAIGNDGSLQHKLHRLKRLLFPGDGENTCPAGGLPGLCSATADNTACCASNTASINVINTRLGDIDNEIITIEGDITNIEGDITIIEGDINSIDNDIDQIFDQLNGTEVAFTEADLHSMTPHLNFDFLPEPPEQILDMAPGGHDVRTYMTTRARGSFFSHLNTTYLATSMHAIEDPTFHLDQFRHLTQFRASGAEVTGFVDQNIYAMVANYTNSLARMSDTWGWSFAQPFDAGAM